MKLNAPPSPPEDAERVPQPDTPVDASSEAPRKPLVEATPTWPRWFGPADAALAFLVVVLGFLLASFAARNSEVWLHLASGRLIAQGQYAFGVDPFSYATAGRLWVNHSWLFDFLTYEVFTTFGGAAVVALKAAGIALAAVALLSVRRPGFSWRPWVVCVTLALLAAAPRMVLGPFAVSIVFQAVLMYLVFRVPGPAGSWRMPILIAGLFALWANLDSWFFVGPLTLAMLLIGTLLQGRFFPPEQAEAEPETLGTPAASTLGKALVMGVLACMIQPHHIHVWDLPLEVKGSERMSAEPLFARTILLSPLDQDFLNQERNGRNLNGLAYLLLFLGTLAALGFGGRRLRLGPLVLGVGFALLSLRTVAAIPLFAVVAVPLIASEWNSLSARFKLRTWSDPHTRLGLSGSTVGRLATGLGLAALLVLVRPGWLHPKPDVRAETPRMAWGIEPDPALRKAAEQIEQWRESGKIKPDEHGFILSTALANYCAWFAPHEKVFLNGRFAFHEPELSPYTLVRSNLGTRPDVNAPPNMSAIEALFRQYGVAYLTLYERGRPWARVALTRLLPDDTHWALWYLDGRTGVFGWRSSPTEGSSAFRELRLDLMKRAFGPDVPPVPRGEIPTAAEPSWFFTKWAQPIEPVPPEADESLAWHDLKQFLQQLFFAKNFTQQLYLPFTLAAGPLDGLVPYCATAAAWSGNTRGENLALPLLALRDARRAVAANPNHPDSYYALFQAVSDPDLPMNLLERRAAAITALQQCLALMPDPADYRPQGFAAFPPAIAASLGVNYLELSGMQLDDTFAQIVGTRRVEALSQARQAFILAIKYADAELALSPTGNPELQQRKEQWAEYQKDIETDLVKATGRYEDFKARNPQLRNRYVFAREQGLTEAALDVLQEADLKKEFGEAWPRIALQQIGLELVLGRLADATQHLASLDDALKRPDFPPQLGATTRMGFRRLFLLSLQLEGDYAGAIKLLDADRAGFVGRFPPEVSENLQFGALNNYSPIFQAGPAIGNVAAALQGQARATMVREVIQQFRRQDAEYFFQRGVLALFEGKNAAARESFLQTARPPVKGWNLPPTEPPLARLFIQLIDAAAKP